MTAKETMSMSAKNKKKKNKTPSQTTPTTTRKKGRKMKRKRKYCVRPFELFSLNESINSFFIFGLFVSFFSVVPPSLGVFSFSLKAFVFVF